MQFLNEYKSFFWILALFSVLLFLLSLLVIPLILIRIPENYFIRDKYRSEVKTATRSPRRILLKIICNILGWVLLLCGLAMLVLPGQGILTILISITLIDSPYKRRLEYYLISRPMIIDNINKLRKRGGVPPLRLK